MRVSREEDDTVSVRSGISQIALIDFALATGFIWSPTSMTMTDIAELIGMPSYQAQQVIPFLGGQLSPDAGEVLCNLLNRLFDRGG